MIFVPAYDVIYTMVEANLKFAEKDELEDFLLRFGLV
jgi:hypothetical protein